MRLLVFNDAHIKASTPQSRSDNYPAALWNKFQQITQIIDDYQINIVLNGGDLFDIPIVVLINQGSASGSEIVAGAVQDRERGILLGERTFGKGTVQEVDSLSKGGALKITIAKWLTPNGNDIDSNGLNPDIEVELGEEDGQLERAVEEIEQMIAAQ